ncbi:hypothetical protein QBC45DRAFT_381255 [Copromyces sp. CBS 386.78]|nr:hypothetical protein QBC45DRAFT_381255 [Copromyces sp. CBS 386.78]
MEATDEAPTRSPRDENRATEINGSKRSGDETPIPSTSEMVTNGAKKRRLDDAGEAQVTLELTEADDNDGVNMGAAEFDDLSGHAEASFPPSSAMHGADAQEELPHIIQSIEVDAIEQEDVLGTASPKHEATSGSMAESEAANATTWKRSPRSPSPLEDPRIPLWKAETRSFKGTMFRHSESIATAIETAEAAQNGDLFVDGAPQFAIFCDGSSENTRFAQFHGDRGGYGVVFRDPYESGDHIGIDLAPNRLQPEVFGKDDVWGVKDFVILNWLNRKTYSAEHAEISALAQGLEEIIKRVDRFGPPLSTLKIFSDSAACQNRIASGILVGDEFMSGGVGNNYINNGSNVKAERKRKRKEVSFSDKHTNPIVRAIIWQSHYLFERGCTIEIHWIPRNLTFGAYLADHVAGLWRGEGAVFSQSNLAREQRDGIIDKLSEEVNEIVRRRSTPPPHNKRWNKKRKLLRPPSKKKGPGPPKNMLLPKKGSSNKAGKKPPRSVNILNARRSFAFRPSPSPYRQAPSSSSSSQLVPAGNTFPAAAAFSVSEPLLHQDEHRPPTLDTFPTWFFPDAVPPRKAPAPTPGVRWEIKDEDEVEVGIVGNEKDEAGEMEGGEEVEKEKEQ